MNVSTNIHSVRQLFKVSLKLNWSDRISCAYIIHGTWVKKRLVRDVALTRHSSFLKVEQDLQKQIGLFTV